MREPTRYTERISAAPGRILDDRGLNGWGAKDMSKKLEGKVAVVTRASKGIGASIAKALAEAGVPAVVNYSSSKQDAEHVVAEISLLQGDVSTRVHIERLFSEAKRTFDRLDILVNNGGVYEFSPLDRLTEEHFRK